RARGTPSTVPPRRKTTPGPGHRRRSEPNSIDASPRDKRQIAEAVWRTDGAPSGAPRRWNEPTTPAWPGGATVAIDPPPGQVRVAKVPQDSPLQSREKGVNAARKFVG